MTMKSLYNHKERSKYLSATYGKLSKIYRDQLLSKALMILEWNKMRSHYQNSLYNKAYTFYITKRQSKVFSSLKAIVVESNEY